MKKLLEMLKSAREEKGFSQGYISVKLKVSPSTISRWELGRTAMTLTQIEEYALAEHLEGKSKRQDRQEYALAVEIDLNSLFAFLASNGESVPSPIAEIHVEVFSANAFNKIVEIISSLGMESATMTTKRLRLWK